MFAPQNNRRGNNRLRHAPTILAIIAIVTVCTTVVTVFQIFPHAFDKSAETGKNREKVEWVERDGSKPTLVPVRNPKVEEVKTAVPVVKVNEEEKQQQEKMKQEMENDDEAHRHHHQDDDKQKEEEEEVQKEKKEVLGGPWARNDEAFVLLLTNDGPMHLVWALEGSFRDVGSTRRRIALCTPAVSEGAKDTLRKLEIEVRDIEQPRHKNFKTQFAHWQDTLAKLAIFDQKDLRQLVYLDADTLVNHNIDDLFSRNTTSMVYGMRDVIDCVNGNPHLNAGLLVTNPNSTLKTELMAQLEDPDFFKVKKGDQEMLDVYLIKNGMLTMEPETTMSFLVRCHCLERRQIEAYSLDDLKIVHFTKWFIDAKGLLSRGATETSNCGNRWYIRWLKVYRDLEKWWNEHYDSPPILPRL